MLDFDASGRIRLRFSRQREVVFGGLDVARAEPILCDGGEGVRAAGFVLDQFIQKYRVVEEDPLTDLAGNEIKTAPTISTKVRTIRGGAVNDAEYVVTVPVPVESEPLSKLDRE